MGLNKALILTPFYIFFFKSKVEEIVMLYFLVLPRKQKVESKADCEGGGSPYGL